ncbi:17957_t:CDS:2, partial [Funneliformis geosporum]
KKRKQYESIIVLETPEIKYTRDPSKRRTPLSIDSKLITLQKAYLVGQGGSRKTTQAIRAFPGRKVVVLIPANLLAEYHRKQNPGLTAMIYHKYFHLMATPIDE